MINLCNVHRVKRVQLPLLLTWEYDGGLSTQSKINNSPVKLPLVVVKQDEKGVVVVEDAQEEVDGAPHQKLEGQPAGGMVTVFLNNPMAVV